MKQIAITKTRYTRKLVLNASYSWPYLWWQIHLRNASIIIEHNNLSSSTQKQVSYCTITSCSHFNCTLKIVIHLQ